MTSRRVFLAIWAVPFLASPLAAHGQSAGKPIRIGVLTAQSRETSIVSWESFRQGLRDLGWENGRNLIIEERFTDGNFDRLPVSAQELLKLNVALIVAANSPGAQAAISATKTVPIVMVEVGDPVATGFVTSLARPGGNVTGVSNIAKRLLDLGFYAPSTYFPLIVEEALMIEPTETESKDTLDEFCDAMIRIAREAESNASLIHDAPVTTPVRRLDQTKAAREPDLRWRARAGS